MQIENLIECITKSIRGREKLVYKGFQYNFKEEHNEKWYWRCNV
jgi:hypothetical protein